MKSTPVPDDVELSVVAALRELELRSDSIADTDQAWTREIKNTLGRLGRDAGYTVYASSCDSADDGEWLFDLTWMKYDTDEYMTRLPLILESEWTPIEISDDFCKLVVARAEHRVMVFWANNEKSAVRKVETLATEAAHSKTGQDGDRYLFAIWLEHEEEFAFRLHVVGDGMASV